ncbi:MAG: hypothetical protein ACTHNU_15955 [Gaiellales bacterium]
MRANGDRRVQRAQRNEQAFQDHNERRASLEEIGGVPPDEPVPFVCECDDPECVQPIMVSVEEYERAASPDDQFLVAPGHDDPAVERVVEIHPAYVVVSKPSLKRR